MLLLLLVVMVVLLLSLLVHEGLGGCGILALYRGLHVFQLLFLCGELVSVLGAILAQRHSCGSRWFWWVRHFENRLLILHG